jgi:hypothetical protein
MCQNPPKTTLNVGLAESERVVLKGGARFAERLSDVSFALAKGQFASCKIGPAIPYWRVAGTEQEGRQGGCLRFRPKNGRRLEPSFK